MERKWTAPDAMNFTRDQPLPEQPAPSEGPCVALLPQKQSEQSTDCESPLLSCPVPSLRWSNLCWLCQPPSPGHCVSQPGTPAPRCEGEGSCVVPGYCPGTVWGSCSERLPSPLLGLGKSGALWMSRPARGDAGLEAHESQPRQTPRSWLGQRRGKVSDPSPTHESAWKDLQNGDYPTIWCLRAPGCSACIEASLFDP